MSVFGYHFIAGFFVAGHSFKGFWAEYAACRLFAQLIMLAAVQSWFAWPDAFDSQPLALRVCALGAAACSVLWTMDFCVRNLMLCLRNVEYSEEELAARFDGGRRREAMLQTVIDAQLAVIARIQELAPGGAGGGDDADDDSGKCGTGGADAANGGDGKPASSWLWIAFRHVQLLARWNAVTSDKLPANLKSPKSPTSPSQKKATKAE